MPAANEVADSLNVEPPAAECRVVLRDLRDLAAALPAGVRRCTAIITSPPYPNRMSYICELRRCKYWLGCLSDGRVAGELDWKAIGGTWGCATSMLNTWTPNGHGDIPFPQFYRIIREISAGHALLGRVPHVNHLAAGTMLAVEDIYAALFEDAGFVSVRVETIRKRTSKKELFEFVVHAHAPSGRGIRWRSRRNRLSDSLVRCPDAPPTPDRRTPATRAIDRHAEETGTGIGSIFEFLQCEMEHAPACTRELGCDGVASRGSWGWRLSPHQSKLIRTHVCSRLGWRRNAQESHASHHPVLRQP
ncbi:MAG: hypothetical protein HZB38_06460 [Planctomycetes bacterium]|nr:hypothetical protein [Planctomycetota bacterium]